MMRKHKIPMGIALALTCASAYAESESGFYAGLGLGKVTLEDSFDGVTFKGSDNAFKLFGGYQFHENFAAELAYADAGNPDDTIFGVTFDTDGSAIQASLIGTLPVNDRFSLFLRGSLLAWDATNTATDGFSTFSEDTDGNDFAYGLGASLAVVSNFRLRAEFEGADLDGTDFTMLSLSGLFSF